jgi:nucleoside-diphosphate-sugar epimerase
LIFAANGRLAPYVVKALESDHELRLTDIIPMESKHEFMEVNISDLDAVMRAAEGMDAIINLSVLRPQRQLAWDVNTLGCYNIMRAAVAHGIPRVINTGPHFTVEGAPYERWDYDIGPDVPPKSSTNLYAISKGAGQEICRIFTEHYDVYVMCYLFYNFRNHEDPTRGRNHPFAVTWRDAGIAFVPGLEINLETLPSRCEVFNIFTDLPHRRFDNEKTKRILGWQPQDLLEEMYKKKLTTEQNNTE